MARVEHKNEIMQTCESNVQFLISTNNLIFELMLSDQKILRTKTYKMESESNKETLSYSDAPAVITVAMRSW